MKKTFIVLLIVLLSATLFISCDDKLPTAHKVTFDSDGGSDVASVEVDDKEKVTEPTAPTKPGYVFKYWSLDGTDEFNFDTAITDDITLKAVWRMLEAGDTVTLGTVTWSVLAVDTDDTALLISQDILEKRQFHSSDTNSYNNSDIHTYLKSDEFLKKYGLKKDYMVKVDVTSTIERTTKDEGSDYVFLLSGTEVDYFFKNDAERVAKFNSEATDWWLRSKGNTDNYVRIVDKDGAIIADNVAKSSSPTDTDTGLRPAFWYKWN